MVRVNQFVKCGVFFKSRLLRRLSASPSASVCQYRCTDKEQPVLPSKLRVLSMACYLTVNLAVYFLKGIPACS